ncbi:carbohydrate ABC transporter permease [Paenibacillus mendelii]|uniref:Carbohydrate ABC transporter permease n=1 Tax=Paenibacillus mendelii TaxID=206163 RepID=A0ABV6J941_9BACL|nr:carbohydrate ABC transporter permease [Paenibacillus mendelii]MCQ6561353.1 carbohydrate ABC transporter permease [Paenibacillus mendelii]
MSLNQFVKRTFLYGFLFLIAIVVLYPLAWVYMSAIKTQDDFFLHPWGIPRSFHLEGFKKVITEHHLHLNILNSTVISILTVGIVMLLSTTAAFGLTRLKWQGSKLVLAFFLLGLLIPVHSTLIPIYISLQGLREYLDPRLVIVLPYVVFGLPTAIMILSGYFSTLPRELEESAVLDGSSIPGVFARIIIPISAPAMSTVAIFTFMGTWNELLFSLVFLIKSEYQTVPVAILQFMGLSTDWPKVLASIALTIAPSLLVYMFLQNKIIQGVTAGSVKG